MNVPTNDNIQLEKILVRDTDNWCETCKDDTQKGEPRYRWRMHMDTSRVYHNGSFWTNQCNKCFRKTCEDWSNTLTDALRYTDEVQV